MADFVFSPPLTATLVEQLLLIMDARKNDPRFLQALSDKLAAIQAGATANQTDAFLLARANHTGMQAISTVTGLQTLLDSIEAELATALQTSQLGVDIAQLDGNGKVPLSQINDAILGQVEYMGLWDADLNDPTLPATSAEKGHYYIASTAGTQFGLDFAVGDWIISNGASWDKVDNTDAVSSVAGKTGNVTLVKADVGLANVDNTADADKPVSTAQQTALDGKQETLVSGTNLKTVGGQTLLGAGDIPLGGGTGAVDSVNGRVGDVVLAKADVGLDNVDNTSDANKPVSTATQAEITRIDGDITTLNADVVRIDGDIADVVADVAGLDSTKVSTSALGVTVAELDGNGKVPLAQINDAILGQVEYMGLWDASTNDPTLPATPAEKGHYYIVSVAGTQFSIDFALGDWIISNGDTWDKVDNTDAVNAVAGKTGNVTLVKADVGLANVDNTADADKPVSTAQQTALDGKLPQEPNWYREKIQALGNVTGSAAPVISAGGYITATATGATSWTFNTTGLSAGYVASWILKLTNGGAFAQTFTGVKWTDGTPPTLTAAGVDRIVFTYDGTDTIGGLANKAIS